ncbi:unnamed protein product, partial [Musa hybrid cultivar]
PIRRLRVDHGAMAFRPLAETADHVEEWKNPRRGGASVISTADRRGAVLLRTHPPRDLRSQST